MNIDTIIVYSSTEEHMSWQEKKMLTIMRWIDEIKPFDNGDSSSQSGEAGCDVEKDSGTSFTTR